MADNTTTGTGVPVATRSVTYSGDAAQNVQAVAIVTVSGSDDSKTATDLALGQTTMSASLPVTIASNQTSIPVTDNAGSLTVDAPVGTPVFVQLSDGSASLVGQKVMTNSVPVVIASNQSNVNVSTSGSFAVQDSQKVDDNGAFTDGSTKVQPAGYIYDETAGIALTENDAAAARIDNKRAQVLVLEDAITRGQRAAISALGGLLTDFPAQLVGGNPLSPWTSGTSINSVTAGTFGDYSTVLFAIVTSADLTGSPTVRFEASYDNAGSLFTPVYAADQTTPGAAPATTTGVLIASQVYQWRVVNAAGWTKFQAKLTAVPSAGSIKVYILQSHSDTGPIPVQGVSDNAGSLTVDNGGTFAVQPAGSVAHDGLATSVNPTLIGGYASAAAPSDVSGDGDSVRSWVLRNGASATVVTAAGALIGGDAANGLDVDVTRVSGTVTTSAAGPVAHDASTASNPQTIGGRAVAHGANPTAVAAADVTDAYFNRAGVQFTIGGHPNIVTIKHTTITTAVTDAAVVTVAGGLKIVVTSFMFTLDNASTVFPTVLLGFAAANTPTTTGVIGAHGGVPAGGGFGRGDGSGILGIGADGEDLRVTTTGNATGNGLQLVVSYFTIES